MSRKQTLLMVEDETSILQSVQRILELTGDYEVLTATNGKKALDVLSKRIPDLIISDIIMPEMDGIELCRAIRKEESTRSIPFIFLTARQDKIMEGVQTGSDDFIVKPFQVDELLTKIKSTLRRIQTSREQARIQKGQLSEYDCDELLNICDNEAFSGELLLRYKEQIATIFLEKGEIKKIDFGDRPEDQALDIIRRWKEGTFLLKSKTLKLKSRKYTVRQSEPSTTRLKLTEPIEIAKNIWWVGRRTQDTLMQTNVYLRQFATTKKAINYLVDPGSMKDFPVISKKISNLIGDVSNVNVYSLTHHEPNIAMNAVYVRKTNPRALCVTSEESWRLLTHYDIDPASVKLVNEFKDWRVKLSTGHEIFYMLVPFCPYKGTFLTYDIEQRVLFTGELFSGISNIENFGKLWAGEEHFDGITAFHQLYMPSNKALRYAIQLIRKLQPEPRILAPHYGALIKGDYVKFFMDRLFNAKVGADLLELDTNPERIKLYSDAINEIIKHAHKLFTKERVYKKLVSNESFHNLANFDQNGMITIFTKPEIVVKRAISLLIISENDTDATNLKSFAFKALVGRKLPAPSLEQEATGTFITKPKDIFSN